MEKIQKMLKLHSINNAKTSLTLRFIYALFMGLSCASFCAICNSRSYMPKPVLISFIISFAIGVIVSWEHSDNDDIVIDSNWKYVGILVIALYLLRWLVNYTNRQTIQYICDSLNNHIGWTLPNAKMLGIICALSIPFTVLLSQIFLLKIWPALCNYYKSLDTAELSFYIIVAGFGLVITTICFILTTAFWMPTLQDGTVVDVDVIYLADTGVIVHEDAFINIGHWENDIRQPLFAVFAIPFSLVAHFISTFLPFITTDRAYGVVMTLIQILIVTTIGILIIRMIGVEGKDKPYYFLVYALCFPNILFAEVLEQYAIATFYVVLCIYFVITDDKERYNPFSVAATGTLITSGILIFFSSRTKSFNVWIRNLGKVIMFGLVVTTVFGQLPILLDSKNQILYFINSYGGIQRPLYERFLQYSNVVNNVFLAPLGVVSDVGHPAYLSPSYSSVSVIGIIVLLIAVAGWWINRGELFSNICFIWILLSQAILVVVGWGSVENGMVIYSLYFSWAYISLVFYFVERVLSHKKALLFMFALVILIWNFRVLISILSFAHLYYPVW